MEQGGEVEAALLKPFLRPAHVAGVELGLAFIELVGRAHPAEQRGADARRARIGNDLEIRLGAVGDLDEDQVRDLLVEVEGEFEGFLLPGLETLGDHRRRDSGIGGILGHEDVTRLCVIDGDDVLALDPVAVARGLEGVAGIARTLGAVGIARGPIDLAAPVDRMERAVDVVIRDVARPPADVLHEQLVIAGRIARRPVRRILIVGAGVDVIGAAGLRDEGHQRIEPGRRVGPAAVGGEQQVARRIVDFEIGVGKRNPARPVEHEILADIVDMAGLEFDPEEVLVADHVDCGDDMGAIDGDGLRRADVVRNCVGGEDQRKGERRVGRRERRCKAGRLLGCPVRLGREQPGDEAVCNQALRFEVTHPTHNSISLISAAGFDLVVMMWRASDE